MGSLAVQIERLEPMRVATLAITSDSPEQEAMDALLAWARPQGLLNREFRFFGFDNCQPAPKHTYTTWLSVGPDVQPSGDVTIREFSGGLYAVTELQGVEQISPRWHELEQWCLEHHYADRPQVCLEEPQDHSGAVPPNELRFKLYRSIRG